MARKSPVRHVVRRHKRIVNGRGILVRTHARGSGAEGKKPAVTPSYLAKTPRVVTEQEIKLWKRRLNDGKIKSSDIDIPEEGLPLTAEQDRKGYKFLMSLWKGISGKERKDNPFGYREQNTLENFKEFRLVGFHDAANYYQAQAGFHNYVPDYRVVNKNPHDPDFEYYYDGGEINITG